MRHLFVLLLTATCLQAGAQAPAQNQPPASVPPPAPGLPPCDKAVRFHAAWFADPEVDNSKSAAELTKLAPGGDGGPLQLGHVVVETKLAVVAQTACRGVVVRLDYVKPVLRVASEYAPGSCAHARVMNHELTHVRIHRDIARQFRELDYAWGVGASSAAVLAFARQELDRLMRAQELFDSPEEYAKSHSVCGGEIARLVKPSAAPARASAPKAG